MERLVARVSGRLERGGYRSKVVTIARAFGIKGSIQDEIRPDSRDFNRGRRPYLFPCSFGSKYIYG